MSSNTTVLVDATRDKLYVYISATSTYTTAESKCNSMQPVPGATTTGNLVVYNTYSEQVRALQCSVSPDVAVNTLDIKWAGGIAATHTLGPPGAC